MLRKSLAPVALTLAVLACSLPGLPAATPVSPDTVATSVAATLTALAPPATLPPSATPLAPTALTPTETPGPLTSTCSLAYADGNQVYCLSQGGTSVLLADTGGAGAPGDPAISPDGALVAYRVSQTDGTSQLWVAAFDGSGARLLVGRDQIPAAEPNIINSPLHYEWQAGTRRLIFDTSWLPVPFEGGPGEYLNADLWSVDADTGVVTPVLPKDSAGRFAVSPDGGRVALSRPTGIDLVNSDGTGLRHVMDFPFINTASEYAYKPEARWSPDGAFFSLVIPSPDPLAPETSASFYRVGADGVVQPLATVPGNFVFGGDPRGDFAPNGEHVAYGQYAADGSGAAALHLFSLDGSRDAIVDSVPPGQGFVGLGWSPDSQSYAYARRQFGASDVHDDILIVRADATTTMIAPGLMGPVALRWRDAGGFIVHGALEGEWALIYQGLGGVQQILATTSSNVTFDVRP
jgi:hypothetical protein